MVGIVQTTNISNATKDTKTLNAIVSNDINVLIKQENKNSAVLPEVKLNDNLKAPIKSGDIIGSVTYTVEGIKYTENLLANNNVKKSRAFIRFIEIIFVLFLCYLYLKIKQKRSKNRRLKK
ncbi:MAG: hypothetical protein Q4G09_04875 [Clostridia bacterium]|nr:hypothetical protein [Clostridia bacterium]